jgi:hypothetical protein
MPDYRETGILQQVLDVFLAAGREVVKAGNLVPPPDQSVAQMRAQESSTTRDKDAFYSILHLNSFRYATNSRIYLCEQA